MWWKLALGIFIVSIISLVVEIINAPEMEDHI
ncbi:Uncharacterised protein [Streptococcus pseudoporcinus]|uniref:Uncharacterized protein n=1 Tax=Streptococcus pseudoporcinus TaxID=361101 RepID=A0A4U9XKS2_9STRE|nr:hypothetical protein AT53_00145 [Streptococcus equi subsp. zooepidemicus Sz5]VTS12881.1 Uncharacterised protein [Streptococcus pseudoporcinus]VUC65905.1 Uncharacterised protein [Streptococcus pseudoporcinus]VUC96829.1 Uncharacterised protein [Streptococcus pseudoporcinus]VUC97220.1 Uncharacterised protein [Streptococcus pseudoporcinus]